MIKYLSIIWFAIFSTSAGAIAPALVKFDHMIDDVKFVGVVEVLQAEARSERTENNNICGVSYNCLLYTSPSPRDRQKSRMPSSA